MTGYNVSLQGNITGFKKVSSVITQYNALSASGTKEQNTFANAVSVTNGKLGTYLTGLNGAKASLGGYVISLVGATVKTVALKVATIALNSAITMGASLIISGIVSAISEWIHKTENMISASEDAIEKIKSINDELKNNQKTISDTAKRYAELAQGVDQLTGKNISLSNEDYEEFLDLSNQIAEIFPELPRIYKENGDAIVQLSGDVDTIVGSLQNLIEAQRDLANRQIVDELPTVFKGIAAKSNQYEEQLSDLESRRDALVKSLGDVQSEEFSSNFMDGFSNKWIEISGDNLEVISQMRDDYMKILKEANIDFEELTPTYEIKYGVEIPVGFTIKINSSDEDVEKAKNTIDGKIQELASQYETDINKLNEEINTTNKKNKANWTSLSSSIFAWLSTDDSFKVMDDTMQATVQNIVNSLDWGSLDFSSWEDAKQYIQENILSLFNTSEGKETLKDIEVMFGIQTQFNNGDISVEQYQQKLQDFLNSIENLPPETKKSILLLFGIQTNDDGTTTSDVDTMIENVKKKLKGTEFDDKVGELSLGDLKIAADLEVGDDTIQSWDELITKIEEYKEAQNGNETDNSFVNALKSSTDYSDYLSKFQTLTEQGGLSPDVLSSTEEYANILEALGYSAEDAFTSLSKLFGKLDYSKMMDGLEGTIGKFIDAEKELQDNGKLSFNTVQDLLEIYPDLKDSLTVTTGGYLTTTEALEDYIKAQEYHYSLAYNQAVDAANAILKAQGHKTFAYEETTDAIIQEMKAMIAEMEMSYRKEANEALNQYNKAKFSGDFKASEYMQNLLAIQDSYTSQLNDAREAIINLQNQLGNKTDFTEIEKALREDTFNGGSSSSSSSSKTFDWIDTAASNINDELDDLNDKVSDTYATWTERNNALQDAIAKTNEAINLQSQAYDKYMDKANSVGLSNTYKTLVQDGAIDISTITDETLKDKISEYQTWYEKAQECLKTQEDLKQKLKEINSQKFDNIKSEYDSLSDTISFQIDLIQGQIDLLEMKGKFANESYYNNMILLTQQELDNLKKEREQLQSILNNSAYDQGSEQWNNMFKTLLSVDSKIQDATSNLEEFNNAIRNLDWEIFEYLEDSISRITDETEYFVELLSKEDLYDDNGNLTKYADATIGLHATAYETYKKQAQDYYEEVQELQKQLVDGAGQDVLEQYYNMVDAHQDAILAAEQEKEAILDLIEDGYNAQLDALNKLIKKRQDALNAEKNLYDYQKSIKEKTSNISSLEKQKLAYEGDTSEEGIAQAQKIKVQLEEAKADLKETEYEQYLSDTETMLSALTDEYENWMNARLDDEDTLLKEIIGEISEKGESINDTLSEVADTYGTYISDSITSIFDSTSPFTTILNDVKANTSGTITAIERLMAQISGITGANDNAGSSNNTSNGDSTGSNTSIAPVTPTTPTNANNGGTQSNGNGTSKTGKALLDEILIDKKDYYPKESLNIDSSIVDRLKSLDKDSSFSARAMYWSKIFGGTYTASASQNVQLLNYLKANGYKKGSSNIPNKQLAWTQEDGEEIIYRASDGAMLTPLGQGDMIFTNEASKVLWDLSKDPSAFLEKFGLANITPQFNVVTPTMPEMVRNNASNSVSMNVDGIEINLPNVTNYKEFRNELIKDSTFTNAMGTYVNNKIMGKNPLEHLKYAKH